MTFTHESGGEVETRVVRFGAFQGRHRDRAEIARALSTPERKELEIVHAGTAANRYLKISYRIPIQVNGQQHSEDELVVLRATSSGDAMSCDVLNARSGYCRYQGTFMPMDEERMSVPSTAGQNTRAMLLEAWKAEQRVARFDLVSRGVLRDEELPVPGVAFRQGGEEGHSHTEFGRPVPPLNQADFAGLDESHAPETRLQEDRWVLADLLRGVTRVGDDVKCAHLEWSSLPQEFEEFGDNFSAPGLTKLDFYRKIVVVDNTHLNSYTGYFRRFGDNFSAPSLTHIDLAGQSRFTGFGRNFHVPNLVNLNLRNAIAFTAFPDDFSAPELVTLSLVGARNFNGFPPHFFDNMPRLRHLELAGTGVAYEDLPEHVTNNPAIRVDIQAEDRHGQPIDGEQTTHTQSVHFSSTQSAKRIMAKANDADLRSEFAELQDYIDGLEEEQKPEDNSPHVDDDLQARATHARSLDPQHPLRLHYSSPVMAAKRAVSEQSYHEYVDPLSEISVLHYLAACWYVAKNPENRLEQVADETVLEKFVQVLYEIERGYNLTIQDGQLVDDGDPRDARICGAGAFNKITNVMSEILVDAQTIFITDELVEAKVRISIEEKIRSLSEEGHLTMSDLTEPDDDDEIHCSSQLAERIRDGLLTELSASFALEGEPIQTVERRTRKIAGYLDYLLKEMDVRPVMRDVKWKAPAR